MDCSSDAALALALQQKFDAESDAAAERDRQLSRDAAVALQLQIDYEDADDDGGVADGSAGTQRMTEAQLRPGPTRHRRPSLKRAIAAAALDRPAPKKRRPLHSPLNRCALALIEHAARCANSETSQPGDDDEIHATLCEIRSLTASVTAAGELRAMLQQTGIGRAANKMRKHAKDAKVRRTADEMVRRWRGLLALGKSAARGSSSPSSSTSSSSSPRTSSKKRKRTRRRDGNPQDCRPALVPHLLGKARVRAIISASGAKALSCLRVGSRVALARDLLRHCDPNAVHVVMKDASSGQGSGSQHLDSGRRGQVVVGHVFSSHAQLLAPLLDSLRSPLAAARAAAASAVAASDTATMGAENDAVSAATAKACCLSKVRCVVAMMPRPAIVGSNASSSNVGVKGDMKSMASGRGGARALRAAKIQSRRDLWLDVEFLTHAFENRAAKSATDGATRVAEAGTGADQKGKQRSDVVATRQSANADDSSQASATATAAMESDNTSMGLGPARALARLFHRLPRRHAMPTNTTRPSAVFEPASSLQEAESAAAAAAHAKKKKEKRRLQLAASDRTLSDGADLLCRLFGSCEAAASRLLWGSRIAGPAKTDLQASATLTTRRRTQLLVAEPDWQAALTRLRAALAPGVHLFEHQLAAVRWMLGRERHKEATNVGETSTPDVWWEQRFLRGAKVWVNLLTGTSTAASSSAGSSSMSASASAVVDDGDNTDDKSVAGNRNVTLGGLLADDMGLGKTLSCLALIAATWKGQGRRAHPGAPTRDGKPAARATLVVVPSSVIAAWERQLSSHFGAVADQAGKDERETSPSTSSSWSFYRFQGSGRRRRPDFLGSRAVVLTSYATLSREHRMWEERTTEQGDHDEAKKEDDDDDAAAESRDDDGLFAVPWLRIVCDEGHLIRNHKTVAHVACRALTAERRWWLSGTPLVNSVDDLFGLISFLQVPACNAFANFQGWTHLFGAAVKAGGEDAEEALSRLSALVAVLALRREKSSIMSFGSAASSAKLMAVEGDSSAGAAAAAAAAPASGAAKTDNGASVEAPAASLALPAKRVEVRSVPLTPMQRTTYELIFQATRAGLGTGRTTQHKAKKRRTSVGAAAASGGGRGSVLECVLRLRQVCCAASLVPPARLASARTVLRRAIASGRLNASSQNKPKQAASERGADAATATAGTPAAPASAEAAKSTVDVPPCHPDAVDDAVKETTLAKAAQPINRRTNGGAAADEQQSAKLSALLHGLRVDAGIMPKTAVMTAAMTGPSGMASSSSSSASAPQAQAGSSSRACSNDKAVVFSSFVGYLDFLAAALTRRGILFARLDGRMSSAQRLQQLQRFNSPTDADADPDQALMKSATETERSVRVMLVSTKAGGLGLTLTAANIVYIMDPWWNEAVELQAMDRCHRIGQRKRVHVVRFVAAESVEERMLQIQRNKKRLAAALSGNGSGARARAKAKAKAKAPADMSGDSAGGAAARRRGMNDEAAANDGGGVGTLLVDDDFESRTQEELCRLLLELPATALK